MQATLEVDVLPLRIRRVFANAELTSPAALSRPAGKGQSQRTPGKPTNRSGIQPTSYVLRIACATNLGVAANKRHPRQTL
jgi:hypothetical protein